MTGDALFRPRIGTAAGVPYVALPPTAVDADPDGPVRLVAAWHGFDPPRTERAFSAAVPMTGLPAWRVYLRLPMPVGWPPPGRDDRAAGGLAAEQAAEALPAALDELRAELGVEPGPIGLVGISAGALAVLLTLAEGSLPVTAAALIAPAAVRTIGTADATGAAADIESAPGPPTASSVEPSMESSAESSAESSTGSSIPSGETRGADLDEPADTHPADTHPDERLERFDISARTADIARSGTALMLVSGEHDELVTAADLTAFRDLLRSAGLRKVEAVTFRMGHELATEPGTDAEPPIPEAVSVDGALTDWFRTHLGTRARCGPAASVSMSAGQPGTTASARHRAEAVVPG